MWNQAIRRPPSTIRRLESLLHVERTILARLQCNSALRLLNIGTGHDGALRNMRLVRVEAAVSGVVAATGQLKEVTGPPPPHGRATKVLGLISRCLAVCLTLLLPESQAAWIRGDIGRRRQRLGSQGPRVARPAHDGHSLGGTAHAAREAVARSRGEGCTRSKAAGKRKSAVCYDRSPDHGLFPRPISRFSRSTSPRRRHFVTPIASGRLGRAAVAT